VTKLRSAITTLVLVLVVTGAVAPKVAVANHITCTVTHAPIARMVSEGRYMVSGFAQSTCTEAPSFFRVDVDLAVNFNFTVAAADVTFCPGQSSCIANTIEIGPYGAHDWAHTRARVEWDNGHGERQTIPLTNWACYENDPLAGGRVAKGPGHSLKALTVDGGKRPGCTAKISVDVPGR
jgi:hypothetical protein